MHAAECVIVGVSPYSCCAEVTFSPISTHFLCLGVTQMPKCRDLAIQMTDNRQN